jgi:hypothetical protein
VFARDTGWRRETGFGWWLSHEAPDGTAAATDDLVPEYRHIPLDDGDPEAWAVSLSWYDACQFARWLGARLLTRAEVAPDEGTRPELEWTSDWLDESRSLISVSHRNGTVLGVNPDVRAVRLGFRVGLSQSPGA